MALVHGKRYLNRYVLTTTQIGVSVLALQLISTIQSIPSCVVGAETPMSGLGGASVETVYI